MLKKCIAWTALALILSANAFAAEEAGGKALNNGQDVTRLLARFNVCYSCQLLAKKFSKDTFIFRTDRPFRINEHWQIGTRLDLPAVLTHKRTAQGSEGSYKFGLGDTLSQVLLIREFDPLGSAAAGTQFVFPTARTDQMGDRKYPMVPTAGVRTLLPELSDGSFGALLMRYTIDYAGSFY
ncbi:MAG TPA: hypothetical protein PLL75_01265 [Candidatus Omnitrophota bacterium]|nr:hypothetical protein [Candidatus Omnitrophota bacterium]HPS36343.1 hypothetical protein [Candidatus Omnitrophota bacterium]